MSDTELERRVQELIELAWEWGYWECADSVSTRAFMAVCKADTNRVAQELKQYIELTYKRLGEDQ